MMNPAAAGRDPRVVDRVLLSLRTEGAKIARREFHPLAAVLEDRDPAGHHGCADRDECFRFRDGPVLEIPRIVEVRRGYFCRG